MGFNDTYTANPMKGQDPFHKDSMDQSSTLAKNLKQGKRNTKVVPKTEQSNGVLNQKQLNNIDNTINSISKWTDFLTEYTIPVEDNCFRKEVNKYYNATFAKPDGNFLNSKIPENELGQIKPKAAYHVWKNSLNEAISFLNCKKVKETKNKQVPNPPSFEAPDTNINIGPFDRRLDRIAVGNKMAGIVIPYDTRFRDSATSGLIISAEAIGISNIDDQQTVIENVKRMKQRYSQDPTNIGIKSIMNNYSVTKLYGSHGGEYLIDRKDTRKWYEIDSTNANDINFTKNPTTTSIINWGDEDPYGRTPYQFSDFVFAKHWNKIPNNRLITLRRYPAPIIDNLKFPGMDGHNSPGSPTKNLTNDKNNKDIEMTEVGEPQQDGGSSKKVIFTPMATAITYFGEGTGNSLSNLLKFTTGFNWKDLKADIYKPSAQQAPDNKSGLGSTKLFGGLASLSKMLNVATGNFDDKLIMNNGNLPPDPYTDGPYSNRVIGPINVIDSVKKRERGLQFSNSLPLNFEYVARPIGGINTKAVLLDIISNFMVLGSASAMFWGGQHRFMTNPAQYPFMGGDKGIQEWYSGHPLKWGETTILSMKDKVTGDGASPGILNMMKDFFHDLFGGNFAEGLTKKVTGLNKRNKGDVINNVTKHYIAKSTAGQIPYLSGMKALLIGEPVGEWHVTIGNPLNPIAMIGNLIVDNMTLEFGEELGPDDFPLEVKITINLQHGMPRDRDAIQSIFNRGMGRIYDLPDNFHGSADFETKVDNVTGNQDKNGTQSSRSDYYDAAQLYHIGMDSGNMGRSGLTNNAMHGAVSIWNRATFNAVSPNDNLDFNNPKSLWVRSEFRTKDWISKMAIK